MFAGDYVEFEVVKLNVAVSIKLDQMNMLSIGTIELKFLGVQTALDLLN